MLIDDNADDNFFHERVINKCNAAHAVVSKQTSREGLKFLRSLNQTNHKMHPDLIFLDINMQGMNGWEFLDEYNALEEGIMRSAIIVILTTSENPDDKLKVEEMNIASDFRTKPLTHKMLNEVIEKYFKK